MDVAAEASFEAAHMLSGYDGDCHNINGHSYKVCGGSGFGEIRIYRRIKKQLELMERAAWASQFKLNVRAKRTKEKIMNKRFYLWVILSCFISPVMALSDIPQGCSFYSWDELVVKR